MSKHAILLVGGKGTRLRPYTVVLPKSLMPIGDYPILEVVIRQLVQHGFKSVTMAVGHQAQIIQAFFGDGSKWGVDITYSIEDQPLGTMGPLKLIQNLPDNFLVMNGDILTDLNFSDLYDFHVSKKNIFTISSYFREHSVDYGVLESDSNGMLTGFKEKPRLAYEVSMGIYIMNRKAVELIPPKINYGFDGLMLDLIDSGDPAVVKRFGGYWLDIGRPDDYAQAIDQFDSMKSKFLNG